MKRYRVAVIVGTRPEAIKMAPVIRALSASRLLSPITLSTSQHRHMVHQIFGSFGIRRYHDLRVMRPGQTLWDLSGRLAARLGQFFEAHHVDAALVQGDTSSAFFGSSSSDCSKPSVARIAMCLLASRAFMMGSISGGGTLHGGRRGRRHSLGSRDVPGRGHSRLVFMFVFFFDACRQRHEHGNREQG